MAISSTPTSVHSIRVLHIDDSPDDREIVKLSLQRLDPAMDIVSASSPTESLQIMEEQQIDCMVSDYSMPEMNGIELCWKIRETSDVPYIIYTGRGSEEVASVAFDAGADDYLRKEPGQGHDRVRARLGLGLTSTKRMVDVQGGTISVETSDGERGYIRSSPVSEGKESGAMSVPRSQLPRFHVEPSDLLESNSDPNRIRKTYYLAPRSNEKTGDTRHAQGDLRRRGVHRPSRGCHQVHRQEERRQDKA